MIQKNLDLILIGVALAMVIAWSLVHHGEKYEDGKIAAENVQVIGSNQEKKDEARNMPRGHTQLINRLRAGTAFGQ